MALTLKKRFKKRFFGYYPIISYHFLKPLMGFIALLTLSKVKFIYTEFYQCGCVLKKRIKGV